MENRTFTPASASKYLRTLDEQKAHLLAVERETCTYRLSVGEEGEPPAYDYEAMCAKVDEIDAQALAVRHALHVHNARTVLPKCGLTVDEALIAMAQLSHKKSRLATLRGNRQKERVNDRFYRNDALVEYQYANYSVEQAERDYDAVVEAIGEMQLELDLANQTETFEVAF